MDAEQGRVGSKDDQDISEFNLSSLRKEISLVTQETSLFNDTIEANIRYGKLNADRETIRKVAKEAGALTFIDNFPKGLFLRNVTLYFSAKDLYLPVTLQIRPIVNGFPSASKIVPFSEVILNPDRVQEQSFMLLQLWQI